MNVLKIILKVLLTILRVPFTVWYIVAGLILKVFILFGRLTQNVMKQGGLSSGFEVFAAVIAFEWASLVKFYHLHW